MHSDSPCLSSKREEAIGLFVNFIFVISVYNKDK